VPYIGAIYDKEDGFRCGATLIADNAILTAYHCFTPDAPVDGAYVRLGSTDRLDGGTVAALTGPPVQVVDQDAAIIMLRDPVSIPPAILSDTMLAPGQPVLNVGWGLECSYDEPDPSQIGTGPVPVVPCPELPRYLKKLHSTVIECPDNARHSGDVCSRSDEPGGRTHHGDSGSPLFVYGSDGVWRVAGVASGTPIGDPSVAIYAETGFSKPQIGSKHSFLKGRGRVNPLGQTCL
jgi:secreted trypsin-like serine protease